VLRTRSPLRFNCIATAKTPFDLHVLTTPPAFILSQDQTLRKELEPSDSELLVSLAEAKLPYLSFLIGGPNQSHRVNFKEPFPWGKRSKRTDRRTVVNHFFGEISGTRFFLARRSIFKESRAPQLLTAAANGSADNGNRGFAFKRFLQESSWIFISI
jgi:hypothetical protein